MLKSVKEAVGLLQKFHQQKKLAAVVGGGSEYLQLMKDHVVEPDYVINLKTIPGLDYIQRRARRLSHRRAGEARRYRGASGDSREAVDSFRCRRRSGIAADPQRRHHRRQYLPAAVLLVFSLVELHLPAQRRPGCYTVTGDGRFHAILGAGPSYIVHPSDTAPALVALGAQIKIAGPAGEKTIPLEKFFVLPSVDYKRENILNPGEIVTEIYVPTPKAGSKGFYHKVRERWRGTTPSSPSPPSSKVAAAWCAMPRVVMGGVAPIPWRAPKAEEFLRGKRLDEATAKQAGEIALEGAKPLKDNVYKVKLAQELIQRGLLASI